MIDSTWRYVLASVLTLSFIAPSFTPKGLRPMMIDARQMTIVLTTPVVMGAKRFHDERLMLVLVRSILRRGGATKVLVGHGPGDAVWVGVYATRTSDDGLWQIEVVARGPGEETRRGRSTGTAAHAVGAAVCAAVKVICVN